MTTVRELKDFLDAFLDREIVYAYSGEKDGIVILSADTKEQIGFLEASEPE